MLFRKVKETIDPIHYNDYYFEELGNKKEAALELYSSLAQNIGIDGKDADVIYRHAWCALKLSGFNPRNILELGTYKGHSAVLLAMLFPEARVYTVDLPEDDPLFAKWKPTPEYQTPLLYDLVLNIKIIRINTIDLFLWLKDAPDFDLIFIDAGHQYPSVAVDHALCVNKLTPGGYMFSDDAMPAFDSANGKGNAIYETLQYVEQRHPEKFRYLLQREDPKRFKEDGKRGKRKYVAFMRKNG